MGSVLESSTVHYAHLNLMEGWVSQAYKLTTKHPSSIRLNAGGIPLSKQMGSELKVQLWHFNQSYFSVSFSYSIMGHIPFSVPSMLQWRHGEWYPKCWRYSILCAISFTSNRTATYHTWYHPISMAQGRPNDCLGLICWILPILISATASQLQNATKDFFKYLRIHSALSRIAWSDNPLIWHLVKFYGWNSLQRRGISYI